MGENAANREKASAGRYLLIFCALVVLVAITAVWNRSKREDLESYRYPTGLGDFELFDLEAQPPDPERPLASLDGVGYFAAAKPEGWRDQDMVPVGVDDQDQYIFYRPSETIGGGPFVPGSTNYLKVDHGSYISVRPASELEAAAGE